MTRIFILDDHIMFAEGLAAILRQQDGISVSGCFSRIQDLFSALEQGQEADILLLDLSMPDGNGSEVCTRLATAHPTLKPIIVSMHDDGYTVRKALKSGAKGYLLKNTAPAELLNAIRQVVNGQIYLSAPVVQIMVEPPAKTKSSAGVAPHLTNREREVLGYLVQGFTSGKIAEHMSVTVKAVEFHRSSLLAKFDVNNAAALVKKVTELNILNE